MTEEKIYNKITDGVIWKEVLLFFFPLVIGAFFQHLYTLVDTMIVGKALGTTELSAVGGSAAKFITLYLNFFIGVSSGITAYASRYLGEKNYPKLTNIIFNGTMFFVVFGTILSVLGIVFSPQYFDLMNTPTESIALATTYLHTYLYGMVFAVLYNTFAGIMRGLGDSKKPLYALFFCSICNIVLDVIFVFPLQMGVFGIALATVISQGISAVILGYMLFQIVRHLDKSKPYIDITMIKDIAKIGIPAGCQSIMYSLSNMAVQSGVNGFSDRSVAAWVTFVKLSSIPDIFLSSLGSTVMPFVGQNLGAKKIERVTQSLNQIIAISFAILSVLVALFLWQGEFFLGLFTYDQEVIAIGMDIMWVVMPMHILAVPQQMYSQALRSLGQSFIPMIMTLVGVVGLRLAWVTFILPIAPNLQVLGACYPASALLMSVVFAVYYRIEFKKITLQ
ncbi:MAG: MATE family efflux transporter [Bacillota bacterium]